MKFPSYSSKSSDPKRLINSGITDGHLTVYKGIRMGEHLQKWWLTWCTWYLCTTRKIPQNTWNSKRSRVFSSAEATCMKQVSLLLHWDALKILCMMKATTTLGISFNIFPVTLTTSEENWILFQSVVNFTLHFTLHFIAVFKELFFLNHLEKILLSPKNNLFKGMEK